MPQLRGFGGCVLVVAALGIGARGCAPAGDELPEVLVDGTPARLVHVQLEGVEVPALLTSVDTVEIGRARERAGISACLSLARGEAQSPIVVRVGVDGRSVTYRSRSGRGLYACDDASGALRAEDPWCGSAFGLLSDVHVGDSRLTVGCATTEGEPVAFAWVEPGSRARYVAVRRERYAEVYETRAELPIRVTTTAVEIETSSASLRVSEHSPDGDLIRAYLVEAVVAG